MKFQEIVFFQGEEANEPLDLWNDNENKALEYMLQWDFGEGEIYDYSKAGSADYIKDIENFHITYNNRLGYIGVERIIKD